MDGTQIIVSKNYGIIKTINFRDLITIQFPTIINSYSLVGIKDQVGIKMLKNRDIYDFNIGDELHYSIYNGASWYSFNLYRVNKVLNRTDYLSGDSVVYLIDSYNWGTYPNNSSFYQNDTISYCFKDLSKDVVSSAFDTAYGSLADKLPYEILVTSSNDKMTYYSMTLVNYLSILVTNINELTSNGICFSVPYFDEISITRTQYLQGLGVLRGTTDVSASGSNCYSCESLVYYKKKSIEYGNPLNIPVSINKTMENRLIQLYPNPSTGIFQINFENEKNENEKLIVYNNLGVVLKETDFTNKVSIDLRNYSNGLYLFKIITNKNIYVINVIKNCIEN